VTGPDSSGTDRLALAQQVIRSAADILVAAGFGRGEIGSFFRQAADHLGGAEELPVPSEPQDLLAAAFAESPAMAELSGLGAPPAPAAPLRDRFDYAMKAIPLVAEAQLWLRRAAGEAGLPMLADRDQARDGEAALCYEDFAGHYAEPFAAVGDIALELAALDDEEAFAFLPRHMTDTGLIVSRSLKIALGDAAAALTRAG